MPTSTYTRLLEQMNQSEPVDAGSRIPQLSSRYHRSYSGVIQTGSNRLSPSRRPRAAATGASIDLYAKRLVLDSPPHDDIGLSPRDLDGKRAAAVEESCTAPHLEDGVRWRAELPG